MIIGMMVGILGLAIAAMFITPMLHGRADAHLGFIFGIAVNLLGAGIGYGARKHYRDEASHPVCYQMELIEKEHAVGWFEGNPDDHWRWRHADRIDRLIARGAHLFYITAGLSALLGGVLTIFDTEVPARIFVGFSLIGFALSFVGNHAYAARVDWRLARTIVQQAPDEA